MVSNTVDLPPAFIKRSGEADFAADAVLSYQTSKRLMWRETRSNLQSLGILPKLPKHVFLPSFDNRSTVEIAHFSKNDADMNPWSICQAFRQAY